MAAGQVYDHGFGGANRTPVGGVFNSDQFPDKLASLTSEVQEAPEARGSGRLRRMLAAVGIRGAANGEMPVAADTHPEQSAVDMNGTAMPNEGAMQIPGVHAEIPGGAQDAPPDLHGTQPPERV